MYLSSCITPFDNLVDQCILELRKCVNSCEEIRIERRLGKRSKTTQLDALQDSLKAGPSFITAEVTKYPNFPGAGPDGADDIGRAEFAGYSREINEINACLQSIAYPPSHPGHHHHYHHHHLSDLLFPRWDWDTHHHKDEEHPHFHELRMKWESIRERIALTFAQIQSRLQDKKKKEDKKKVDEDKVKKDKKELQDKLDAIQAENNKKLEEEEKHQEKQREKHEAIEEKRNEEVEKLLKKKLEDNPIEDMKQLATVMGTIQTTITPPSRPKSEDDSIDKIEKLAKVMGTLQTTITPPSKPKSEDDSIDKIEKLAKVMGTLQTAITPRASQGKIVFLEPQGHTRRYSENATPLHITNINSSHNEEEEIGEFDADEIVMDNGSLRIPRRRRKYLPGHPQFKGHLGQGSRSENSRFIWEPETRHHQRGTWISVPPEDLAL